MAGNRRSEAVRPLFNRCIQLVPPLHCKHVPRARYESLLFVNHATARCETMRFPEALTQTRAATLRTCAERASAVGLHLDRAEVEPRRRCSDGTGARAPRGERSQLHVHKDNCSMGGSLSCSQPTREISRDALCTHATEVTFCILRG